MVDGRRVVVRDREANRRHAESAHGDSRGPFRSDVACDATEPRALFDDQEEKGGRDRSDPGSRAARVLLEVGQGDGQPSPDRPLGHAQRRRDLAVGMALEISQGEDLPVLGAHFAKSVLYGVALKGRDQTAPDPLSDICRALIGHQESPRPAVTTEPATGIDEESPPAFSARDKSSVKGRSHGAQSLQCPGPIGAAMKRKRHRMQPVTGAVRIRDADHVIHSRASHLADPGARGSSLRAL